MDEEFRKIMQEDGRDPDETLGDLMEGDDRDIEQLLDDAQGSAGEQILTQLRSLYTTLEIVNKNYQELTSSRDWFLEKGIELWNIEKRDELEAFQREYLRRLHNYSASVHSLIEHAYTILDRYADDKPELKSGYFDEIQSRDLGTKVDLLKQLRHYTQKRELPPLSTKIHAEKIEGEEGHKTDFKIVLDKEEMMDWDRWNSDVRERLEEWDDEIEITNLAEDYQSELNDFFEWFRSFTLRIFYDELKEHVVTVALVEDHFHGNRESEI